MPSFLRARNAFMQTITYFFRFLLLACFLSSPLTALYRDYKTDEVCRLHQPLTEKTLLLKPYLPLIPESPGYCIHVECPICHNTWIDDDPDAEDTGEDREHTWSCECKFDFLSTLPLRDRIRRKYDDLPQWERCGKPMIIYDGYLSADQNKYFSLFYEYLQHLDQNQECTCFWPEVSKKAAIINNTAYVLFEELFTETALNELVKNKEKQHSFFVRTPGKFSLHGVTLSCVCQSFLYSDYEWICRDLDFYCTEHFQERSVAKIRNALDDIRATLAELFLDVYVECLNKHPTKRIKQELYLVCDFLGLPFEGQDTLYSKALEHESEQSIGCNFNPLGSSDLVAKEIYHGPVGKIPSRPTNWLESEICLIDGTFYNNLWLYKEAIPVLTQAIKLNPFNRDAYIERALAYLETNQLPLALKDYEIIKKLEDTPPFMPGGYQLTQRAIYIPNSKTEFAKGLAYGSMAGGKVSVEEFIPSLYSCFKGIINGLWSFVCAPVEVSQDLLNTAYAIGEFVTTHSTEECLHCMIPELGELSHVWDDINDYSRGEKIGYIIGKYGVDIFAPLGAVKGAKKVQALKRANVVYTLESSVTSTSKQAQIAAESIKIAASRMTVAEKVKTGKIFIKSPNVITHVITPEHAWDKVIKLSGNVEEDFKRVVALLEKNNIKDPSNIKGTPTTFPRNKSPVVVRTNYEKTINGCKIEANFETYLDSGESFLKDAWVITR